MKMIQNEVLDDKTTQNIQSGIQARGGRIGGRTWLQLCGRGTQFGREWCSDRALQHGAQSQLL